MKPYYSESGIDIYHGDCREILPSLPSLPKVDLVLTDPPYGIDVVRNGTVGGGGTTASGYRRWEQGVWDTSTCDDGLRAALAICDQAIVWGGNYYALPPARCWLIWNKVQRDFSLADGEIAWTTLDKAVRIIDCPRNPGFYRSQVHPTQKPLKVIQWSLRQASESTALVLDPFMGSGTTLRAAKDLGRKAIGIEIEEKVLRDRG